MKIIHINKNNASSHKKLIKLINSYCKNGKNVFILVYMIGCAHCDKMRPEWEKIETVLNKNPVYNKNNDIVIVDIDAAYNNLKLGNINGYPSMKYVKNGKIEEYTGDRTLDAFIPWIEQNSGIDVVNIIDNPLKGGKTRRQQIKSKKSRKSKKSKKSLLKN